MAGKDVDESWIPRVGAPAKRALLGAGLTSLTDVAALTERQVREMHGVGEKAVQQLRQAMADQGLRFADD